MYTREILAPRASPIEDGIPVIGTWDRAFEKVDLLEIRKSFRYPLPRWARDYRIKEWQCLTVQNDHLMLEALFCNLKLYRIVQVLLYDKVKKQKYVYRKLKPGRGTPFPQSLANAYVENNSSHFSIRIHNWLDADTIKLDINIEASRNRPKLTIHLAYNISSQIVTPMAVSLGITDYRNMYAYKTLAPLRGDIVLDRQHISLDQDNCSGFFCDYKGIYHYRMQTAICSAMGFDEKKRRIGFHIAENQTKESYKNNENAFWVDGQLTPLPPVLITMPNGPDNNWVIQDVEGMVDLTFTPKEQNKSGMKLFLVKADFNAPLGYYNGMLKNAAGEQIQIKNLFGMGKKINLKV